MTRSANPLLLALLGSPVSHSVSPAMQCAALEAKDLDGIYVSVQVGAADLQSAVRGLAVLGFRGANITLPYKETILPMLDSVSDDAGALGAVNTLVIDRDGAGQARILGHNTDHLGFLAALDQAGCPLRGSKALVAGAGGAARAAVFGLIRARAAEVVILARRPTQAEKIVRDFATSDTRLRLSRLESRELMAESETASLLVHATPTGMWPDIHDSIWPDACPMPADLTVFDLVYSPADTKLSRQARVSGARIVSGLEMLVRQGAHSFRLWTHEEAPIEVMRNAARSAIEERT